LDIATALGQPDLSFGQLHVLLSLFRHSALKTPSIAKVLAALLPKYWPKAPYNLCLDLMDAARSAAWKATEEDKAFLIAAIESLPDRQNILLSTAMIDALKSLGALDDDEDRYVETVRANMAESLAHPENEDRQKLAYSIWYGQFDHPYEGAFVRAIDALSETDGKALRMRALTLPLATDTPFSLISLLFNWLTTMTSRVAESSAIGQSCPIKRPPRPRRQ
jgi:hypothetical protein